MGWVEGSFDGLVGAGEDRWRQGEAERIGGLLRLMLSEDFVGSWTGRSAGLASLRTLSRRPPFKGDLADFPALSPGAS